MTSLQASLLAASFVALSFVGSAAPPPAWRDADPSAWPEPRFAPGAPDAREYRADASYPIGDPSTYWSLPFLVGSQSHLDRVFEGRIVHRASTPSPLGCPAAEPVIRYEHAGQTLTVDDYLTRHATTGLLIAQGDTILLERYQYARNDRIASRRGRWPRPSPRC